MERNELKKSTVTRDLFVVSDPHGHAHTLFDALAEAGFDRNDPRHLLVVCGDCFDRGGENRALYRYLRATPNKILLRGNHEPLLENALTRGFLRDVDRRNGLDRTVLSLFGRDSLDYRGRIYADPNEAADVLRFTSEMYDYFETEHYRFVHGWVPLAIDELGIASPHADWRGATREEWNHAAWIEWQQAYAARDSLLPRDKVLVCGHRTSAYGAKFDPSRKSNDFSIFRGDGLIAIDAQTVTSGRVNVLVLRDEEVRLPVTHGMRLQREPFATLKRGEKCVEPRLYDEKRRSIAPRDLIRFTSAETNDSLSAEVLGLHVYPDFTALCDDFNPAELGFPTLTRDQIPSRLSQFYSTDQLLSHRALAIRLKLRSEKED